MEHDSCPNGVHIETVEGKRELFVPVGVGMSDKCDIVRDKVFIKAMFCLNCGIS